MILEKIYETGKKLGLTRSDIGYILSSDSKEQNNVRCASPTEVYKGTYTYGTISIKDFK